MPEAFDDQHDSRRGGWTGERTVESQEDVAESCEAGGGVMDPEGRERRKGWPWMSMALLLVSYPLSLGPFLWLFYHGYLDTFLALKLVSFWDPIVWLQSRFEMFSDLMIWYESFWRP